MPRKPRKTVASLPISLTNLGSAEAGQLNFSNPILYARMRPEVWHLAKAIPVYLVNPDQMDEIYPPQKGRVLDPKRLKDVLKDCEAMMQQRRERGDVSDEQIRRSLWDCLSSAYTVFVAIGLYIPKGSSVSASFLSAPVSGPAIFICPERLLTAADRESVPYDIALAQLYYHELGHAELDSGKTDYSKPWVRVIEESLCNALVLTQFSDPTEAKLARRLMTVAGAEYQGYPYLWQAFVVGPGWGSSLLWRRGLPYWRPLPLILQPYVYPHFWQELMRKAKDYSRQYPFFLAYKKLTHWIQNITPLNGHDSRELALYALRGYGSVSEAFFSDIELPVPFLHLTPKNEWRAFKAGDTSSYPPEFWDSLAESIIRKVAERYD